MVRTVSNLGEGQTNFILGKIQRKTKYSKKREGFLYPESSVQTRDISYFCMRDRCPNRKIMHEKITLMKHVLNGIYEDVQRVIFSVPRCKYTHGQKPFPIHCTGPFRLRS
jgi:hypothetical protein